MLSMNNQIKCFALVLLTMISIINAGCNNANSNNRGKKELISFKPVQGIKYIEVKRLQKNGLAFNEYGYQLQPEWQISFTKDDSARIYSPIKKQFINFPLSRGYDSVFNTARTWLRMRKMNKDSMILEILKAQNDSIDISGAKVFMTFYAENYIKNVLHSDTATLKRPSRRDTLYVKGLVAKANSDINKAFAAREVVTLTSKSPRVKVTKRRTEGTLLNNFDTSDDYLSPTFDITIDKAYQDFYYSFSICVDAQGQMHYGKPLIGFSEQGYEETYIRLSRALMDSYLKYYLQITPGKTLNIPHASVISVHVEGKTALAKTDKNK